MKINGNLIIEAGDNTDYSKLTEVSGSIDVSENATLTAPALTKSGSIDVSENATLTAPAVQVAKNIAKLNKKEFKVMHNDGVVFFCESEKTTKGIKIYSGYNRLHIVEGKAEYSKLFMAEKEGFTAHGETVKEAINDLQYKIVSERLKNEPVYPDTVIDVPRYRAITGACAAGVKAWREQNGITEDEILAKDLLPLLEQTNAYGVERFKQLVNF